MTKAEESYGEYYALTMEISRLKRIINMNYSFRIMPDQIIDRFAKKRREYKKVLRERYGKYRYSRKMGDVIIYLN